MRERICVSERERETVVGVSTEIVVCETFPIFTVASKLLKFYFFGQTKKTSSSPEIQLQSSFFFLSFQATTSIFFPLLFVSLKLIS